MQKSERLTEEERDALAREKLFGPQFPPLPSQKEFTPEVLEMIDVERLGAHLRMFRETVPVGMGYNMVDWKLVARQYIFVVASVVDPQTSQDKISPQLNGVRNLDYQASVDFLERKLAEVSNSTLASLLPSDFKMPVIMVDKR